MAKISERHIKAWEKFNNELVAFTKTFGEQGGGMTSLFKMKHYGKY
jgi:hypothetical protein